MDDICTYRITVKGQLDADNLAASSPLALELDAAEAAATRLKFQTDQAGFIGVIRYLHGRGVVLLSAMREACPGERKNG